MELMKVHRCLGADGGLSKIVGAAAPQALPVAPSTRKTIHFIRCAVFNEDPSAMHRTDSESKNSCLQHCRFFKKNQGKQGTNFAEYFRRDTCTPQIHGNICEKFVQKS